MKSERVLVKIMSGSYGHMVHNRLAGHGCAPTLYGRSGGGGLPTAYIMKYLDASWLYLSDLAKGDNRAVLISQTVLGAIENTLEHILSVLQRAKMVHGEGSVSD
ncbi:hypothetical protein HGRIS_001198 [Hohenbuehelia grisea]|uniref:Uncharacterized protein n=1 Tax=Hohenbuehelia grisea TaxID=104357 RepID=A0ABR3JPL5_9AGAR